MNILSPIFFGKHEKSSQQQSEQKKPQQLDQYPSYQHPQSQRYSQTRQNSNILVEKSMINESFQISIENNSVYHLFIHCFCLSNINLQSEQVFPIYQCLKQLQQNPIKNKLPQILYNLNTYLKSESLKLDSSFIFKAIISQSQKYVAQYGSKSQLLPQLEKKGFIQEGKQTLKTLKAFQSKTSEFSKPFRLIICNGYWCDTCQNSSMKENEDFMINIKRQSIIHWNSIQEYLSHISNNKSQEFKMCTYYYCKSKSRKINGFVQLPQFLFIYLDQSLINNIKIQEDIELFDQLLRKNIPYSLIGYIDKVKRYWKKEKNGQWYQAKFYEEQQINQNNNNNNQQGLLYIKGTSKVENSQQESTIQKVENYFSDEGINNLKVKEETKSFIQYEGTDQKHQKFSISSFSSLSDNSSKYEKMLSKIEELRSNHILPITKKEFLQNQNSYIVLTHLSNHRNLEEFLNQNLQKEDFLSDLFQQIKNLIEEIEQSKLCCLPIKLSQIWINNKKVIQILPSQLLQSNFQPLQLTQNDKKNCLKNLLGQMFKPKNGRYSQKYQNLIQNIEKGDQGEESDRTLKLSKYSHQSTKKSMCLIQTDLSKTINGRFFKQEVNKQYPRLDRIAYNLIVNDKECSVRYEYIQESLPFLELFGYEFQQFVGVSNSRITLLAMKQNKLYSLKVIPIETVDDLQEKVFETSLMKYIQSEYSVKYYESFIDPVNRANFFMVTDYYPKGSLDKYLENNKDLSEKQIIKIFKRILLGIQSCHELNIIHGSIRPESILLGENDEPLISNFWAAVKLEKDQQEAPKKGCNKDFWPFEMLFDDSQISFYTDYYSLGMVLYTLCQTNIPQNEIDKNEILQIRKGQFPDFSSRKNKNLLMIAQQMISIVPNQCMNIHDALSQLKKIEK